jgi:hypothetical protein
MFNNMAWNLHDKIIIWDWNVELAIVVLKQAEVESH